MNAIRACRKEVALAMVILAVLILVGYFRGRDGGHDDQSPNDRPSGEAEVVTIDTKDVTNPISAMTPSEPIELSASVVCRRMIDLNIEYNQLEADLIRDVPHLDDLYGWALYRGQGDFFNENRDLIEKLEEHPEIEKKLSQHKELYLLRKVENFLKLFRDPEFKEWTEEAYEIAGVHDVAKDWLSEWDAAAGFSEHPIGEGELSSDKFKNALQSRSAFYQEALNQAQTNLDLPHWAIAYLEKKSLYEDEMLVASTYHESFYAGRLQEIEAEYSVLAKKLFQKQINGQASDLTQDAMKELAENANDRLKIVSGFVFPPPERREN